MTRRIMKSRTQECGIEGGRRKRMDERRGGEEEWNDERKKKTGRDSKGLGKKRKKGGRR
jgi:hypothetical protein